MAATAHIAAEHGSFNRIRQVALISTHGSVGQRESAHANGILIGSSVFAEFTRVTHTGN